MRYALLVVYSPSEVHLHMIWSSASSSRTMELIISQSATYSCISVPFPRGEMCATQALLLRALSTEMFFLLVFTYKLGAKSLGAVPLIQLECQNCALFPFPHCDHCRGIKKSSICVICGDVQTRPRSTIVLPFIPIPS